MQLFFSFLFFFLPRVGGYRYRYAKVTMEAQSRGNVAQEHMYVKLQLRNPAAKCTNRPENETENENSFYSVGNCNSLHFVPKLIVTITKLSIELIGYWAQFKRRIFHASNQIIRFDAWKIRRLNQLNSTNFIWVDPNIKFDRTVRI